MNRELSKSNWSLGANAAYSLLSLAAPLLFAVVGTPYLVRYLGTEGYGYYSLVLAIIGFGFTTGIGRVAAKYIPENRVAGRGKELSQLLAATLLITASVAVIESLALALMSPLLVSEVLNVPAAATQELRVAIYIACLIGPAMMLSQVFQSAVQGIHHFRIYAAFTVAASFLLNLGSVILAVSNISYSYIFFLNLAITIAVAGAFFGVARSGIPELTAGAFDSAATRRVGRFASSIFVYQSITTVFYLFERSYILRNFGADALTYYTIPFMFGLYLHGLIASFSQVAIPKLNEKVGHRNELSDIYTTFTKIAVAIAVFLALMFFCLGSQFLTMWLGPDFAANSYRLLVIHVLAFATIAASMGCWILSEATHRPGINALSSTATTVVGIGSMILLASKYGTEGMAAGRLLGAAVVLPLIFIVERKVFRKVLVRFWAATSVRLFIAAVAVLAIHYAVFSDRAVSVATFLVSGMLLTGIFWGTLYLSGYLKLSEFRSKLANHSAEMEI